MIARVFGGFLVLYGWYLHVAGALFSWALARMDHGIAAFMVTRPGWDTVWLTAWWTLTIIIVLLEATVLLLPWFVLLWSVRTAVRAARRVIQQYAEVPA